MSPSQNSSQRRTAARTAVVWDALQDILDGTSASVVDIGGGTGGFAVRVAELGHRVTVVDPSPDALAALARRADESAVADLVTGQQGDMANLCDLVAEGSSDIVLCHGVLEIVDDPASALTTLRKVLRPGGTLSLLVSQRHAAVVARAMAGHFGQAMSLLDDSASRAKARRFTAEEITTVLQDTGFDPKAVHAVRVFADLVPSSLVDIEPGSAESLVELERAVADRPEYLPLATQLHVLATRAS
ncbi:MAG: methyltransferase domain-containing protein [Actinomycetota bacterium]|nr:methyltransferase domain-containing protein [Actinomycetota bacterium]